MHEEIKRHDHNRAALGYKCSTTLPPKGNFLRGSWNTSDILERSTPKTLYDGFDLGIQPRTVNIWSFAFAFGLGGRSANRLAVDEA